MRRVPLSDGLELRRPWEAGIKISLKSGDPDAVADLVRRLIYNPWDRAVVRETLAEALAPVPISELTDNEIADLLTRQICCGEWVIMQRPIRGSIPPEEKQKERTSASAKVTGWIEIELVDEDDLPVPNEKYRVELPDGSVREGTLSDAGFARIHGIKSGDCKITFPELDQDVWEPI